MDEHFAKFLLEQEGIPLDERTRLATVSKGTYRFWEQTQTSTHANNTIQKQMDKPKFPLTLKYGGWFLAWVAFSQGCIYLQHKTTLAIMEKVMDENSQKLTQSLDKIDSYKNTL